MFFQSYMRSLKTLPHNLRFWILLLIVFTFYQTFAEKIVTGILVVLAAPIFQMAQDYFDQKRISREIKKDRIN